MFDKEDFELSLESQLKMRVFRDEISKSTDVDALRENLIQVTELLVHYQHLLNTVLKKQLETESSKLLPNISVDEEGKINIVEL
jgi:hypothetical protein|tara:strand:- start:248 stop:499 length:252 start_codon:yes stop_codon:yes gene_type:complete